MTAKGQVAVTVGEGDHRFREIPSADMTAAEAILARAAGVAWSLASMWSPRSTQ